MRRTRRQQVHESSRRGHNDMRPLLAELIRLLRHIHAAQDQGALQAHAAALADRQELLVQLHAQLARRRQYDRVSTDHVLVQMLQDRQGKRERLA